jgi:hypothetical protein
MHERSGRQNVPKGSTGATEQPAAVAHFVNRPGRAQQMRVTKGRNGVDNSVGRPAKLLRSRNTLYRSLTVDRKYLQCGRVGRTKGCCVGGQNRIRVGKKQVVLCWQKAKPIVPTQVRCQQFRFERITWFPTNARFVSKTCESVQAPSTRQRPARATTATVGVSFHCCFGFGHGELCHSV